MKKTLHIIPRFLEEEWLSWIGALIIATFFYFVFYVFTHDLFRAAFCSLLVFIGALLLCLAIWTIAYEKGEIYGRDRMKEERIRYNNSLTDKHHNSL